MEIIRDINQIQWESTAITIGRFVMPELSLIVMASVSKPTLVCMLFIVSSSSEHDAKSTAATVSMNILMNFIYN